MRKWRKYLLFGICCGFPLAVQAEADSANSVKPAYLPEIHGTIRAKYEYQPQISAGRFEVRNARFCLEGRILPFVSYKAEIDLSDEGSIKMLDAYGRYSAMKNGCFTIGQMRVPFTIDAHRSPHQQYFANRSFIAKQVGNIRDVGATILYSWNIPFPITIEGGLFNGSGLTNQKDYWSKRVNYSVKAQLTPFKNVCVELSSQAIELGQIPVNMYDGGINFKIGGLFVEGEFLYKHYSKNAFQNVKAFDGFACYDIPLRKSVFKKISLLARYDMMTDHSNGTTDDNGVLKLTDSERQRVTAGITLSLHKPFISDIRINYEKYFYKSGAAIKTSEKDKFVIEFMTRF